MTLIPLNIQAKLTTYSNIITPLVVQYNCVVILLMFIKMYIRMKYFIIIAQLRPAPPSTASSPLSLSVLRGGLQHNEEYGDQLLQVPPQVLLLQAVG